MGLTSAVTVCGCGRKKIKAHVRKSQRWIKLVATRGQCWFVGAERKGVKLNHFDIGEGQKEVFR